MLARTFSSVIALTWAGAAVAQEAVPQVSATSQAQAANQADEQQQQADPKGGLADIVVTAQRRASNVQDTPLPVSAYDEQRIQDTGLSDLQDLARISPGVSFIPAIANSNFISIRGAVTGLVSPGTDQAASLFLDDVYIAGTSGLDREVFDLERIEVLRGPQGTLFGRNVTGGAISLYTKKPQFNFNAAAQATYGSFNRVEGSAYVTGPLSDKVAVLVSANYAHYDGDYRNLTRGGRDEKLNNYRTRVSLLFKPTDKFKFQLTGYFSDENRGHATLFNAVGNVKGNPAVASLISPNVSQAGKAVITAFDGENHAREYMAVGRADWETSLGSLTSITAYRQRTLDIANDGAFSSRIAFPSTSKLYDRTFSQEVRLASPAENRLRYVLGAYYLNQTGRSDTSTLATIAPGSFVATNLVPTRFSAIASPGCVFLAPGLGLCDFQPVFRADGTGGPNQFTTTTFQDVDTTSYAAFGEFTFDVTDKLSVILGGRYTIDRREGTTAKSPGSGTINNPAVNNLVGVSLPFVGVILPNQLFFPAFSVDFAKTFKSFTPKAGLTYEPNDDVLLYATYSKGFRSGGYSTEGRTAAEAATALRPETAINYELGFKSRFADNRVQVNATGFFVTYNDLQSRAFNNSINAFTSSNVGDVEVYGIEVETLAQVTDDLLLGFNYAFNDGKVTRDSQTGPVPDSAATIQNESLPVLGAKPVGLNKHTLTAFATYEIPLANEAQIRLNADVTISSRNFGLRNNSDPQFIYDNTRNRGVVNGSVSYVTPDRKWEIKAFVRNLTDERHILAGSAELSSLLLTTAEINSGTGLFGTIYNTPRTFGGTVTYRFR
ncbi:MAG: TonB-dependent receptor [Opitutaceae bacterium]